jgi:hypothetical protein
MLRDQNWGQELEWVPARADLGPEAAPLEAARDVPRLYYKIHPVRNPMTASDRADRTIY